MTPRVSVVVPSFNQARYLGETLESLFAQGDPALEVLVADGGSRDGSVEVIRKFSDRITWWVSEPDAGQSDALNKGFRRASGEWLSWLNSDDLLLPGALAAFREQLRRVPDARWFAGGGWFVDETTKRVSSYEPPAAPLGTDDLVPWTKGWFGQPGTLFRRDLFDEAGGAVRTDLRHAMDLDLWLRLSRHARLHPIPAPVGAYRLHGESKTVSERPDMECEVVRVLLEQLGTEAAMRRVAVLAQERFDLERRWRRLTRELRSPAGWVQLLRRRLGFGGVER